MNGQALLQAAMASSRDRKKIQSPKLISQRTSKPKGVVHNSMIIQPSVYAQ